MSRTYVQVKVIQDSDEEPPILYVGDIRKWLADYDAHTAQNASDETEDAAIVVTVRQAQMELVTPGKHWNIVSIAAETPE